MADIGASVLARLKNKAAEIEAQKAIFYLQQKEDNATDED